MRYTKPIAAALALTIGAASIVSTAEARHRHRHHNNGAGLAAAGIFGLAAGAMLGSAFSQPRYYRSYEPVYVAPPPPRVYYEPAPVYYARPDPWTPAWYEECSRRYRSFDARTGYFFGFDGSYHFCN